MTDLEDHVRLEALMADALRAPDPAAAFERLATDPRTPDAFREVVRFVHHDGLRMSALLVARLRFERLMHGSRRAQDWFAQDPDGFAKAFRAYHEAVVPSAALPAAEARLFDAWLDQSGCDR